MDQALDVSAGSSPGEGVWAEEGPRRLRVDGAIWAWTEPTVTQWSAILPLLLIPIGAHLLAGHGEGSHEHSHGWVAGFMVVWLSAWVLSVPWCCHVAWPGGRVERVRCATRGQALRLASTVRRAVGVDG